MNAIRWFRPADLVIWAFALVFLAVAPGRPAAAGRMDDHAVLQAECGSCHVAYPADTLTRAAWGQVLGRLDRHYGVDASLDEASLAAIARAIGTAPDTRAAASLPRITTTAWFREEHDEVNAAVWRRPAVKSASNCDACHPRAARGEFEDDEVRIPR